MAAACPPENCELLLIDTQEGTTRVLYPIPSALHSPAVSPDGTRIAFSSGVFGWNLVEVVLQDGKARILPSLGIYPAWAPSGNHYVFASDRSGKWAIEDVTVMNDGENVSRTILTLESSPNSVNWAPDGTRLLIDADRAGASQLMLSTSSGGNLVPWTTRPVSRIQVLGRRTASELSTSGVWGTKGSWSRCGQVRALLPETLKKWPLPDTQNQARRPLGWSSDGAWILAQGNKELLLLSPDGSVERILDTPFNPVYQVVGFSRDGHQVLRLFHNVRGAGAEWQLLSIDVATGKKRVLADVDLPPSIGEAHHFSMHPDGKRFFTAVSNWPYDIWVLEGFAGK